jgi:hypothetical protein
MGDLIVREAAQFMPSTLGEKLKFADVLFRSNLMPAHFKSAAQVMVALQWGHELGLKPMAAIQNIAVINGKPTLGADIMAALIRKHPEYAGMEISESDTACTVTIRRAVGQKLETFSSTFSMKDAERAGLTNKPGPWKQYPRRMLKHRALAYAARDAFPDVLAGLYTEEEMHSIPHEPVRGEDVPEIKAEVIETVTHPVSTEHQDVITTTATTVPEGETISLTVVDDAKPEPVDEVTRLIGKLDDALLSEKIGQKLRDTWAKKLREATSDTLPAMRDTVLRICGETPKAEAREEGLGL